MVRHGVCPDRSAAFVVRVIEQSLRRMQVAGVDNELLGSLLFGVRVVAKKEAIPDEKRHAHKHAVKPELMLPACAGSVPKAAIGGAGIVVKTLPDLVCGNLVFFFFRLLVHE